MSETDPLTAPVYVGERYKPFGEFTLAEVQARAEELRAVTGFGPTTRVASVAHAWSELARAMSAAGASTVGALERDAVADFARRTWTVPPGGSLI